MWQWITGGRRKAVGAGAATAHGPFGYLEALHFGDEPAHRLQQPPFRGVLQFLGHQLNGNPGVVCFREDDAEVRLVARQSVEGVGDDHVDLTTPDGVSQHA